MQTFEKNLPAGYRETLTVDAGNKKVATWLSVASLVITVVVIALGFLCGFSLKDLELLSVWHLLGLMACLLAYVVLHELVHGLAYKLLTKQKLTFGFTLAVAYCGVPEIYVYRTTAMISLLAPFVVFSIGFGLAVGLVTDAALKLIALLLLAIHLGGCAGDLYDTWLFCTRLTDGRTLMRDTGPKQTFYVPEV